MKEQPAHDSLAILHGEAQAAYEDYYNVLHEQHEVGLDSLQQAYQSSAEEFGAIRKQLEESCQAATEAYVGAMKGTFGPDGAQQQLSEAWKGVTEASARPRNPEASKAWSTFMAAIEVAKHQADGYQKASEAYQNLLTSLQTCAGPVDTSAQQAYESLAQTYKAVGESCSGEQAQALQTFSHALQEIWSESQSRYKEAAERFQAAITDIGEQSREVAGGIHEDTRQRLDAAWQRYTEASSGSSV